MRLEGDVITANGSILSGQLGTQGETISLDDETSVCSCRCSGFYTRRRRPRFTVRRSPGKILHLLPMQPLHPGGSSCDDDTTPDHDDFYHHNHHYQNDSQHHQPHTYIMDQQDYVDLVADLPQHEYVMRPPSLAPLLQQPPIYHHRASI